MMGITVGYMFAFVAAALTAVLAQVQEPIYVPFEWNKRPLSAVSLGSSGATTTYGIIDGTSGARRTAGPGTLFQSAAGASMHWVNSAPATPTTLTGACSLASPVAMCTLNVEGGGSISGSLPHAGRSSTGVIAMMTTLAMGFCVGLAMLR